MNLDFYAPSRHGFVAWLLLIIGGLAAGWVALTWQAATETHLAAQDRLASLQQKPALPVGRSKPANSALLAQVRSDDAARKQLSLPWPDLFDSLQSVKPSEIALLSIDADGRRADFTLTALARNQTALLDFFTELQKQSGLSEVSLSRHEMREVDGVQAVYFSMRGNWGQPLRGQPSRGQP